VSFRYVSGINKPGFNPLAAGADQYKGIWSLAGQANAKALGTWPSQPAPRLYAWGNNNSGQIGNSTTTNLSSPIQIGTTYEWSQVSSGYSRSFAIRTDGTLWAWGSNSLGGLGLGNTTYYSSPKQVGALTNWLKISGGIYTCVSAIKTDGTLWVWGGNGSGQLGLGNRTNYSSPKQVGSLTTWSVISAGVFNIAAIKTDGTLWMWGDGSAGQMGLGNITNYSSPKQVGSLTNWLNVASGQYSTLATKTDGTLWVWGSPRNGDMGLGNATSYSSPKQVGALTNWLIPRNGYTIAGAIKTDGTLWVWGGTPYGIGLGNATYYSSPKQVGSLSTWSKLEIAYAGLQNSAIKTDGTLWVWGNNSSGQLGLGNTTDYSSPKQVGNSIQWIDISARRDTPVAIFNA
jgi:alpha-tubulin suppressor-like RCC1 family protein